MNRSNFICLNNNIMARPLTYKDKVYRLDQEFKKKEYSLTARIAKKYQGRIDKENEKQKRELERKIKQLQNKKKDKLHNLEVSHWKARGNAKIRVEKPIDTSYKDACDIEQLIARLKCTDKYGNWMCICCSDWVIYKWRQLDWWHYLQKSKSRYTALLQINIHAQLKWHNMMPWGKKEDQRPNLINMYWIEAVEKLESDSRKAIQVKPIQVIRASLPILRQLLDEKVFDCSNYYKKVALYEWKYM